jgi:delta1-piperideine-2-carboxylate reductase
MRLDWSSPRSFAWLRSARDGRAVPVVTDAAPRAGGSRGGERLRLASLAEECATAVRKGAQAGIAAVAIRISHHFAAVCPDIEPFAAEGLIALAMVNGRQRMVVWGGNRKLFGTSPMAFACPRPSRLPLV